MAWRLRPRAEVEGGIGENMFVLLVGPKGSGKSHIGRILERRLGVFFFHVEPLWMDYYAECRASGREPAIPEGVAVVHPRIREALLEHEHVCVETTGASPEILDDLQVLEHRSKMIIARIFAPLSLCMERIGVRDSTHQIPMDLEGIREVHALSVARELRSDVELDNRGRTEDEIVSVFEAVLR
jgi:hypothetical protein